jgi:DNA mismatch repair protein MutL
MIRALPRELSDKIAAGEVVERPVSIVKELIENALDAGASAITCEIRKGGKDYIRVTDNGCGIPSGEVELAFMRYATSKIATEDDLNAIGTLGFRGEALASIAAVSRTELITKPGDQKTGTRIRIEGGVCEEITEAACEDGTTILVTDLFYNTPARRKFLKPDNAEAALISDYVSKMALAYPDVRFRLISNGTILYSTLGKGDLKSAILTLYSPQMVKGMVSVESAENEEGRKLAGFVSAPAYSRNNKRMQVFFVNGRWVKSKVMEDALEEAFSDKLFEGRHPAAFLFLEVDPHTVDVNIHPHKTEIKFYDEGEVADFMIRSIRSSLLKQDGVAESSTIARPVNREAETVYAKPYETLEYEPLEAAEEPVGYVASTNEFVSIVDINQLQETDETAKTENLFARLREESESAQQQTMEETPGPRFLFSSLTIIGEAFATYIIAKDDTHVYMIDQHAAHERILYEDLLKIFKGAEAPSQPLLAPILLQLGNVSKIALAEKLGLLISLGYYIEEFGMGDVVVREIPSCMGLQEAEDFAIHILQQDSIKANDIQLKREELTSNACKAAIKGGDKLDLQEMKELFIRLDACENPFSCPHGRPTLIKFSQSDLERQFKRK